MTTRREILKAGAASLGTLVSARADSGSPAARGATADIVKSMKLSTTVDSVDYCLSWGTWGVPGVHFILDRIRSAGITRVFWRASDGTMARFPSKVYEPYHGIPDPKDGNSPWVKLRTEVFDCRVFDVLEAAAAGCKQRGMEFGLWVTVMEEEHGLGKCAFAREHPEFYRVWRNGVRSQKTMSYAYPEVVDFRLAFIKELMAYQPAAFLLDWVRCAETEPLWDAKGYCRAGYEEAILKHYRKKFGVDPRTLDNGDDRWLRFRADYHTAFFRKVKEHIRARRPGTSILSLVRGNLHPYDTGGKSPTLPPLAHPLPMCLMDVQTWVKEGLTDTVCGDQWGNGGRPHPPQRIAEQVRLTGQHVGDPAHVGVEIYVYGGSVRQIEANVRAAREAGAREAILFDAWWFEQAATTDQPMFYREMAKALPSALV